MHDSEGARSPAVRTVAACLVGAIVGLAASLAGLVLLVCIPGAPGYAVTQAAAAAANRGEEAFVLWHLSPECDVLDARFEVWFVLAVLPLAVTAGTVVSARISRGSWVATAIGGLPIPVIFTVGFAGVDAGPLGSTYGVLGVAAGTWAASAGALRLWTKHHSHGARSAA